MKNRMGVPQEHEPVLPGKVKAYIEKKKAQAAEDSLLTQTAKAVARVIGMLQHSREPNIFRLEVSEFNSQDLTPEQFRELKCACVNHLSTLIPGIEKETID